MIRLSQGKGTNQNEKELFSMKKTMRLLKEYYISFSRREKL